MVAGGRGRLVFTVVWGVHSDGVGVKRGAVGVGMGWILSRVVGNGDWMSREGVWWARERLRVMDFYMGPSYLKVVGS